VQDEQQNWKSCSVDVKSLRLCVKNRYGRFRDNFPENILTLMTTQYSFHGLEAGLTDSPSYSQITLSLSFKMKKHRQEENSVLLCKNGSYAKDGW
jgi:hypothetical protein